MPKRVLWKVLRYFYPCVIVILALEIILRVFFHAPMGYFNFLVPSRKGIYPPNAVIFNYWGKIPYTVYSNSQGLRGDELSQTGKRRIVCIGDSNTDGLFVDNNETFPYYLQLLYDDKYPGRFEVINAARGGGSIDKELVLLKAIALPLKPELVVLTFCPNDIHEIYQITLSEALNKNDTGFSNLRNKNRFIIWLVTKTALGETMFRFYHVNFIVKKFYKGDMREFKYNCAPQSQSNIRQNLMIHEKAYKHSDGLILAEPFSVKTLEVIDNYIGALKEFNRISRNNGVRFLFVYFPDYPQVFDPQASMKLRDMLGAACLKFEIAFFDLTPELKAKSAHSRLYLTPLDFHLNPCGNKVFSQALFEYIDSTRLID